MQGTLPKLERTRLTPEETGLPMLVTLIDPLTATNTPPFLLFRNAAGEDAALPILSDAPADSCAEADIQSLKQWVALNKQAILRYWNDEIWEDKLIKSLRPLK